MTAQTITRTDGTTITYLSAADTAKLVRRALRDAFPKTTFSVRLSPAGSSIDVRIPFGGPRSSAVSAVVDGFSGGGFDGSIDLAYAIHAYVRDGKVVGHRTGGTVGSRGYVDARDDAVAGADLVAFGARYVFVSRTLGRDADGNFLDDGPGTY